MSRGLDVGFVPGIDPPRSGAGGPVLIARRFFYASATDTAPTGARRAAIRAVGQGGTPVNNSGGMAGGGGAYARDDFPCAPGMIATLTVGAAKLDIVGNSSPDGSDGVATTVNLNGRKVVAAGGKGANYAGSASYSAPGGAAADCTGAVRRSGGAAGASASVDGSAGTNGGPGGAFTPLESNFVTGGGGAAGDVGDADSLGLASAGVGRLFSAAPGGGGGCYGIRQNGSGANGRAYYTPSGLAVIEYWSA